MCQSKQSIKHNRMQSKTHYSVGCVVSVLNYWQHFGRITSKTTKGIVRAFFVVPPACSLSRKLNPSAVNTDI